jgi:hypothetical protein
MRKAAVAPVAARTAPLPESLRGDAPVGLVCAALVLALLALLGRIASLL